jgi:hypothetical protein
MKLVPTTSRINVIYFGPQDHKGNVFVVDNSNLTVTSSVHSTVATTDSTIVSVFDCQARTKDSDISVDYIDCIFGSHGPFIYRVQLKEDPATGLVEVTGSPLKARFEMYFDNTAVKVAFNQNYFALLTTSVSAGKHRILLYKFPNKGGSNFLWWGIKLDEYSRRPIQDLDLTLLPDNNLLFATNSFEASGVVTLAKSVFLKEAEVTVQNTDINELKKFRIKINDNQADIAQSFIPISDLFLHKNEQASTIGFRSSNWFHWVLVGTLAVIVYGCLIYGWKNQINRRQKLREEVLCNNLGDELRV